MKLDLELQQDRTIRQEDVRILSREIIKLQSQLEELEKFLCIKRTLVKEHYELRYASQSQ